ncbi:hypothetical protein XENOCAPTIV_025396, partial [Xenoophorus captivus]
LFWWLSRLLMASSSPWQRLETSTFPPLLAPLGLRRWPPDWNLRRIPTLQSWPRVCHPPDDSTRTSCRGSTSGVSTGLLRGCWTSDADLQVGEFFIAGRLGPVSAVADDLLDLISAVAAGLLDLTGFVILALLPELRFSLGRPPS